MKHINRIRDVFAHHDLIVYRVIRHLSTREYKKVVCISSAHRLHPADASTPSYLRDMYHPNHFDAGNLPHPRSCTCWESPPFSVVDTR